MSDTPNSLKRPSEIARDNLRRAVRSHPDWTKEQGEPSALSKADLEALARRLGIDPTAAAQGHMPLPRPATPPLATPEASDDDVLAEIASLRQDILDNGFNSVAGRVRDLVIAARKPPVIVQAEPALPLGAHDLKVDHMTDWGRLFGVPGALGTRPIAIWDHPHAPKSNPVYVFPPAETALALSQMSRSDEARANGAPAKHVLLFGPAGTGKSAWAREFAARTHRPFISIPLNDGIEMDQLLGQTVLDGLGGTKWLDGLLLGAMRQPGMVICLDEVGGMRPSIGVALNGLLQDMVYYVPDTGERVPVARGVVFIATNNMSLMEGGAAKGYVGIARQNRAFADRFGVSIEIGYAPPDVEAALLVNYTHCTRPLADLLISMATLTRAKAESEDLTHGIGFRRLLAWAETLTDGIDPEMAFQSAILNTAPDADRAVLQQTLLVTIDPLAIQAALAGKTFLTPSPAGNGFSPIDSIGV